jgi:hypothetical protein
VLCMVRLHSDGQSARLADLYVGVGMLAGFGLASRGGAGWSDSGFACRLWAGSKEVLSG